MIEIASHIEILLLDNDCVIVPGLGGFMAHSVEARYDEKEELFLPPMRTLGFNPQLRINDSLLAQSYVEAYDLSYPEALRRISSEVAELQQHLDNEGSYMLDNVGLLSVNSEGHLEFEPSEAGILTPALYGLCPFEMVPAADIVVTPHQPKRAYRNKSTETTVSPLADKPQEEAAEAANQNTTDSESDDAIVIKLSWIRNAVAVAAAVVAFLLMAPSVSTEGDMSLSALQVPMLMPKSEELHAETLKIDTIAATEVSIPSSDSKADSIVKPDTTTIEAPIPPYFIVLASHVTHRNANDYVKQLHSEGFTDARVIELRNITRVIYGSYNSEHDAYNDLRSLRRSHYFEEAWVMNN